MSSKSESFHEAASAGNAAAELAPTDARTPGWARGRAMQGGSASPFTGPSDIRLYLVPEITLSSPAGGAFLGGSFTVSGAASCQKYKDIIGDETGLPQGDATASISDVRVTLGGLGTFEASPTGSGNTPWASWTLAANGMPDGPMTLTAEVFATGTVGVENGTATSARSVIVDLTPPTLAVDPPADVLSQAPPFIAIITGTAADNASGVAAVEWQFAGGPITAAAGTSSWSAQVPLPGLGLHTVSLRARDNLGNVGAMQDVTVKVGDETKPALDIAVPAENAPAFALVDGKVVVEAFGTASDTQSGISLVAWSLDGQDGFTPALPRAAGDWSTWSASIAITVAGNRKITVRATDVAGNFTVQERAIAVTQPFEPMDPEAAFSPPAYLDDLLTFATERALTAAGGALVSRTLLVDTLLQAFDELVTRDNRSVANLPASQVRLCIDVLRRYLARHGVEVPPDAEAAYRLAAYLALLVELGTSYDEIRLARIADASVRTALAGRLGFGLTGFRPDRLDQLLFAPADLAEAALENLFGLERTALKPLAASLLPEPLLQVWQKEQLRVVWRQQDDAARSPLDTPMPVIDPDLLVLQDLRTPSAGDGAYDLWKARQDELAAYVASLDAARQAESTQEAGFDRIVGDALGPVADLLALSAQRDDGDDIDAALSARLLSMQPFLHLMRVRELAVAGGVLDAEWEDVYAILAQAWKYGRHAAWRGEEQQQGLILGPDFFVSSDAAASPAVLLPAWRSTPQGRQAWRRTLDARQQQDLTLAQALQSAVSSAEESALPLLRDACVAAIAGDRDPGVIGDRLTQELGIDCKDSGHQQTTRAQQALQTLQDVLLSLRLGRFKTMPPVLGDANPAADWVLTLDPDPGSVKYYTESDFDEEWIWMGGYAAWNAAMRVFAYPESFLLPELRPVSDAPLEERPRTVQTAAYGEFLTALRDQPRLTREPARKLAVDYLSKLLDAQSPEGLHPAPSPEQLALLHTVVITDQLGDPELVARHALVDGLFAGNIDSSLQAPNYLQEIFYFVPMALAMQLQKSGEYLVALDWIETVYADHLAVENRKIYSGLALEETIVTSYQRNRDDWLRVGLNPHEIVTTRAGGNTRFVLMTLVRCYLDFADSEFTRDDAESIARARALYGTALTLLALPDMQAPDAGTDVPLFPPNPEPQALLARAQLNLFKLRSGRNIAGIERQAPPVIQPALTMDRLPTAGGAARQFRPTPYRYTVLVERSKNLVSIAQQVEQAFLAALEKRDAETYNLLKAGHDLQLAGATVDLHALQVREAGQGIGLAERQFDRAATQRDTYQGWISDGLNGWEIAMLASQAAVGVADIGVVYADAVLTAAQAAANAANGGIFGSGLGAGDAVAGAVGVAAVIKATAQTVQIVAQTAAQVSASNASFERRSQEWELQRQLAESDMAIGAQQVALAQSHVDVANQEAFISATQRDQAQATMDFLANKFTSAELYAWMSGILGGAYSYFLQQATAMAQQAQYQLAFERQETPPAFIKADYWDAPDSTAQAAGSQSAQPDRQGLTGSVRLLEDITRLDQYAFDTNRRKLQLAEVFSLARLFPAEFQQFRETGSLPFATSMALFDQGFPGHYLRLIKRVRMSVIGMIPPARGVRATLIASGISRVVTGGDVFQTITVRRDPELIAFTSPSNATGILDLEPDVGMLLPFESMGVDTNWELQLPKAANPFDFGTLSDVLFTVEYTALQDFSYRKQVIQQLDDSASAERVFSIRDLYADQWYALHNPGPQPGPMTVQITLAPGDFPPNLQDLRIQQVLLAVVRAEDRVFEIGNTQLLLTPKGETQAVGGTIDASTDGIVSTRRGNGSAWVPLIGRSPTGTWTLTLPDTQEMRDRFADEDIDDLLLVLTYAGRTPAWPV